MVINGTRLLAGSAGRGLLGAGQHYPHLAAAADSDTLLDTGHVTRHVTRD